jgi:hypothetical protein
MSQWELSERAGVHRNTPGLSERAERAPALETINALAGAVGLRGLELVFEDLVDDVRVLVAQHLPAIVILFISVYRRPPIRRTLRSPTMMRAAVAGTAFRPISSYTTLWEVTHSGPVAVNARRLSSRSCGLDNRDPVRNSSRPGRHVNWQRRPAPIPASWEG